MHNKTLVEIADDLIKKRYSSTELTKYFLERVKKYNPKLNSFITITEEVAFSQAEQADQLLKTGNNSVLTGIPLAHKDLFCTKGIKTTCASKILNNFISPYDAAIVENLKKSGMVILGKTNMDEFAMGSSNENSIYGTVYNPWDLQRVPGGSSGGSAAALAARLVPIATGSDTGGSIRQPAAFCGVTGLKPTYGRVSRYGMIAFASSLDQAGLLGNSAEDIALVLKSMAGFDERDSTCLNEAVPDYQKTLNDNLSGLKIGMPKEFFAEGLDQQVALKVQEAINILQKLGAKIVEISLPKCKLALPVYYVIAPAECSSNLARFDGVRYGYRCEEPVNIEDLYMRSRSEGFGEEVKRRIMIGTYVLSAGYYDAYYLKAQKVRQLLKQEFANAFLKVDLIVSPTTPTPAFKIGAKVDPVSSYLNDVYTCPINLAGLPAISVPVGFVNNLPVGMQLIGNNLQEGKLLNVAHKYQLETNWHRMLPNFKTKG